MIEIGPDNIIRRTANFRNIELDGEIILMQTESGEIFLTTETAKTIWKFTEEPVKFGILIDQLTNMYEVDRETCIREVSDFLVNLQQKSLVETGS